MKNYSRELQPNSSSIFSRQTARPKRAEHQRPSTKTLEMLGGFMPTKGFEAVNEEEEPERPEKPRPRTVTVLGLNLGWLLIIAGAAVLVGFGSRFVLQLSAVASSRPSGSPPSAVESHAPPPPPHPPRRPPNKLAVRGVRFEWNGVSPIYLSGVNQPWLAYGHDFGRDRGVAHYCQMREVLVNATKVRGDVRTGSQAAISARLSCLSSTGAALPAAHRRAPTLCASSSTATLPTLQSSTQRALSPPRTTGTR